MPLPNPKQRICDLQPEVARQYPSLCPLQHSPHPPPRTLQRLPRLQQLCQTCAVTVSNDPPCKVFLETSGAAHNPQCQSRNLLGCFLTWMSLVRGGALFRKQTFIIPLVQLTREWGSQHQPPFACRCPSLRCFRLSPLEAQI